MKIKDLIANPPGLRDIEIEHRGAKFTVRGRPDARLIGETIFMADSDKQVKGRHWQRALKEDAPFDSDTVGRVLLVQRCLVAEDGEYIDETEVASLAANFGPLFLALFGAAADVCGLVDTEYTSVAKVASANPLSEGRDGSGSPGTPSKPRGKRPRS